MLKNHSEYQDQGAEYYEKKYRERLIKSLENNALAFGLQLVPLEVVH